VAANETPNNLFQLTSHKMPTHLFITYHTISPRRLVRGTYLGHFELKALSRTTQSNDSANDERPAGD